MLHTVLLAQSLSTSTPFVSTARLYGKQVAEVRFVCTSLDHSTGPSLPRSRMYRVPFLSMISWHGPTGSLPAGSGVLNTTFPVLL